jgi:hypothetical protein
MTHLGDYAEEPETCPATTTCPVVCVRTVADCPTIALCADANQGVCADTGRCSSNCTTGSNSSSIVVDDTNVFRNDDDDDDVSSSLFNVTSENSTATALAWIEANSRADKQLCPCAKLPVACPRVIEFYDECLERFNDHYKAKEVCLIDEARAVAKVKFNGPWFVAIYAYFGGLAVAVMLWCYYNQIVSPVPTSTLPLQQAAPQQGGATPKSAAVATSTNGVDDTEQPTNTNINDHQPLEWTQTGYKINLLGSVIDTLVELSFALIQFLLLVTTIFFYMQQGAITRWDPVFKDEVQVLKAFIMVWMMGFFWCFAFRYPSTGVQSLFLRRCELHESSYVAVVAPIKTIHAQSTSSSSSQKATLLNATATMLWTPLDVVMRTIFSYPYDQPGMETVFCLVEHDLQSGTRSILHRMRRYVYDDNAQCYIPCAMSVGTTFGDLMAQVGGLTRNEAQRRLGRQGPNVIPLSKPTIFGSLYKEFKKSFYLYQNFCIWAFANFWFFFMSFVYTFYRFVGALVVVYFQHRSESLLYNLSHVEGTVE